MRNGIGVALLMCACRTQPFAFGDLGDTATQTITDQSYDAHVLATGRARVAIYERSVEGGFCAVMRFVLGTGDTQFFDSPDGFGLEHVSYYPYRNDCFSIDPTVDDGWGAEASGSLAWASTSAAGVPCSLDLHAQTASHLTESGAMRPAGIVSSVDFAVDNLAIDGQCK